MNAWTDPNFVQAVEATGRKRLVMGGVTKDICLVFPAIDAIKDGFEVQAVINASGSPYDISEEMARRRMQSEGVVLTATETILSELVQVWNSPTGKHIQPVLTEGIFRQPAAK